MSKTCKELRPVTEERHVWLTQFERLCAAFRQTQFHSRTKEPHVHSTAQLKSWAIQHARTDALWVQTEDADDNLALQSVRTNDPEHARYLTAILLPGGEYLVAFTTHGKFLLKKIERGNNMIGDSEWVLTDVARYTPPSLGVGECFNEVFTDTICDYPLIAYHDRDRRNARYVTSFVGCSPRVCRSQGSFPLASPFFTWITTLERFPFKRGFGLTLAAGLTA